MKRFSFKLLALTLLVAVAAYSCIDDKFDTPPIVELPEGSVLTIQKLKELCPPGNTYKINGDSSLYAVVTMDEMSGNIYRNIFVQDNSGAANLRFGSTSGLYEGDSIRLYLKGAVLSWYNNLFQIDSLHADYNVVKQATERFVEPEVATISQINLDKDYFQSRLVKIEDVQIRASDTASIWAPYQQYGEIYIEDTLGNNMMIRTSGYAKFAGENVPNGYGSIIAIVGLYRETVQLGIRRTSEVKLDSERWIDGNAGDSQGTGTFEDPYNVAAAITNNSGADKWVKGYMVGVLETTNYPNVEENFDAPFVTNSNILIADSPDETNVKNCLTVQLPFGDVRTAVNLANNPDNHKKEVKLKGSLGAYFNQPGLRDASDYWLDGDGGGGDENPIFSETFATGQGNFTIVNVLKPDALDNIWYHNTQYSQMAAGAYKDGTNHASEAWLISPAIDLSSLSAATFTFDHAGKQFGAPVSNLTIQVSTVYSGGEIKAEDWTEITIPNHLSGETNTFKSAGDMDLTPYCGNNNVRIAFKYTSTSTGAGNWYLKNVTVK